jgi:hypothetical protein
MFQRNVGETLGCARHLLVPTVSEASRGGGPAINPYFLEIERSYNHDENTLIFVLQSTIRISNRTLLNTLLSITMPQLSTIVISPLPKFARMNALIIAMKLAIYRLTIQFKQH